MATIIGGESRLIRFSASGLAGVWAEENTRESIYDAFKRKETFATSGPRMKIRLFAGYDLADADLEGQGLLARAYANNTAMGGDLAASSVHESDVPGMGGS